MSKKFTQTSNGLVAVDQELTKREMFAMHANTSGYEFNDLGEVSKFIGREIDASDTLDITKASFELAAKLQVMAADALLAELEK